MDLKESTYFKELKKEVAATFQKTYPGCNSDIAEWKGQDIVNFQEELIKKVHGRISEKWFYTHIKSPASKLPRIDMLNMLSLYAGYKGWSDFIATKHPSAHTVTSNPGTVNSDKGVLQQPNVSVDTNSALQYLKRSKYPVLFGLTIILLFVAYKNLAVKEYSYKCCFVDMDGTTAIKNKVRITLFKESESPVYMETNADGCLEANILDKKIKFIITTPYFRQDTFSRVLYNDITEEKIQLRTDDYALMIHYFSKSKVKDWAKRRLQLDDMISPNAKFFQVYEENSGMELYNKREFIDKLTLPLKSLKNIQILDVKYSEGKIIELRFIQSETK